MLPLIIQLATEVCVRMPNVMVMADNSGKLSTLKQFKLGEKPSLTQEEKFHAKSGSVDVPQVLLKKTRAFTNVMGKGL